MSDEKQSILSILKEDFRRVRQKEWHIMIVSYGSFFLLTFLVLILIDYAIGLLGNQLFLMIVGIEREAPALLLSISRVIGALTFVTSVLLRHFKSSQLHGRPERFMGKMLFLAINLLVYVGAGIGLGIIITFAVFLWSPKLTERWTPRKMQIYHMLIVGVPLVWIVLEIGLSEGFIGTTLLPALLTRNVASYLGGMTGTYFVFGELIFLVVTVFFFLPAVILKIWDFRIGVESFWGEFVREKMGLVGLAIVAAIILMAVFAPFIAPYPWSAGSLELEDLLQPPSPEHLLGTNQNGQDLLSRIIYGSQISLLVGFSAAIVAVFMGTFVGLISGYFGGFIDSVLMRITDVFLCLPVLPLMLVFLTVLGQGIGNVILVIAITGWTGTARMVRSEALSLRERPLTEAVHALGASDGYILIRHIFPNTLPLILANVILGVVNSILSEAGISFLGFVPIHGQPSWGIVLYWASKSAALLNNMWWWIIPPGLLILLTTLGFAFVSHATDKVVNPRLRGRRG